MSKHSAEKDAPTHEHEWEVEHLPDPMSAGSVVPSGDLACPCGATRPDSKCAAHIARETGAAS